jgi:hypothetical protein
MNECTSIKMRNPRSYRLAGTGLGVSVRQQESDCVSLEDGTNLLYRKNEIF